MSITDEFVKAIESVNLAQCSKAGMDAFMQLMRDKVPQGKSPYDGQWVDNYNAGYARKVNKNVGGPVNLDVGMKRYERDFSETIVDENSVTREYDESYKAIFNSHQTGNYGKGKVKPREIIPQSEEQVPESVYLAMVDEFAKQFNES